LQASSYGSAAKGRAAPRVVSAGARHCLSTLLFFVVLQFSCPNFYRMERKEHKDKM
jgi:hypothetical protein